MSVWTARAIPRGLSGDAVSSAGRILAAADSYHALTEARPHRPPRSAADAAAELRAGVSSGRLDGAAVDAVLRAAGHRVRRRREWPAGLTAREVEIVRLLVRGLTAKAIAVQLVISPKTASSHIEHIYAQDRCVEPRPAQPVRNEARVDGRAESVATAGTSGEHPMSHVAGGSYVGRTHSTRPGGAQ